MGVLNILLSMRSSVRRRYLYALKREYVERMLAERLGSCEGCEGVCCFRTRRCPFLKDGKCRKYHDGIPFFCKVFPIDERDIELSAVADVCKYYWKNQPDCAECPADETGEPSGRRSP